MMKQILAAAVAAAVLIPAASAADTNNVTVYGKVDLALTKWDRDTGTDDWGLHENGGATKIGFKGTEDLGDGLKAIWKLEMDAFAGRDPSTGSGNFVNRNAYVGLAGDWGTALAGRHDTPFKMAFGSWDLFADTVADFNNSNMAAFTDRRAQDAIAYVSPSMNGLSLAAAVVTGSGTTATSEDIAEGKSIALNYNNNGIMAAVAWEELSNDYLGTPEDDTQWGLALGYKGNGFFVGGRYDQRDTAGTAAVAAVTTTDSNGDTTTWVPASAAANGVSIDAWALFASYDFGNNTVKGTYQQRSTEVPGASDRDDSAYAIGLDHNFSKRTKAYVLYTGFDGDVANTDSSAFSLGMSHSF